MNVLISPKKMKICIEFFPISFIYHKNSDKGKPFAGSDDDVTRLYPWFQDTHVMIVVGFGFLMTFLKRFVQSKFLILEMNVSSIVNGALRVWNKSARQECPNSHMTHSA